MSLEQHRHITKEELENNYEYKLMKRIVKQEFPWIKDILPPDEEDLNKYGLLFLKIVVDPFILQKEVDLPLERWIKSYLVNPEKRFMKGPYAYYSSYLSTMFGGEGRDILKDLQNDVETTMRSVSKSPAIPHDLKLGKDRNFSPGEFYVPEMVIPEDAYFTGDNPPTD